MGGIATGTPFTGSFSYESGANAPGGDIPYFGGTKTIYPTAYTVLTLSIGGQTVQEVVPGALALFDSVSPPHSVPVGDLLISYDPLGSVAVNPSIGSFVGLTPNFIYLTFYDISGSVFSGTSLPSVLNLTSFTQASVGINFGPFGAGNTTALHTIETLEKVVPESTAAVSLLLGFGILAGRRTHARSRPWA